MAWNNPSRKTEPVTMDSRKFLGALNESAQAKLTFFDDHVKEMGRQVKRDYKLTALFAKELYFEDVNSKVYFAADHSRMHGKVVINNIRQIQIVEQEKKGLFTESCLKLIDAIEENDQRAMQAAFNRMKAQRFSGRAIPESGVVRCRDGVTRQIKIHNESINEGTVKARIVKAIVEQFQDKVLIENGQVVAGYFGDNMTQLPITKWGTRKLVASRMREAAYKAYMSEGFQNRIVNLANLVAEGKIEAAVKYIASFLRENEEFTLLGSNKTKTLVENALAARGVFNQRLCDDTALLFHRTNLKANRETILREWKNIAKNAEHPVLIENVMTLGDSKNFENSYDKFIQVVFETMSNKDVAAHALATTLEVLRDKTPRIKESSDLSGKLTNLIHRLQRPDFDDNAIFEAEDLIATIQEELAANETLNSFDQIPGEAPTPSDDIKTGGMQPVVININAPLVQTGGEATGAKPEAELEMPEEPPAPEGESDAELEALLAEPPPQTPAPPAPGQGQAPAAPRPAAPAPPLPGLPESRARKAKAVSESSDPYAEDTIEFGHLLNDYGTPAIRDGAALGKVVRIMHESVAAGKMRGKTLAEALEQIAIDSLKKAGYKIPAAQLDATVEQVLAVYSEEAKKPWEKDSHDKKAKSKKPWEKDSEDEEGDEEGMAESQLKSPRFKKRGISRSSIAKESIQWTKVKSNNVGSFLGVNFLLENQDGDVVVISEDGETTIPVPGDLKVRPGTQDTGFKIWLEESLDQLKSADEDEEKAFDSDLDQETDSFDGGSEGGVDDETDELDDETDELDGESDDLDGDEMSGSEDEEGVDFDGTDEPVGGMEKEASVTIKAKADGGIAVDVSGDVDVNDDGEMKPVDTVAGISGEMPSFDTGGEDMPDFAGMESDLEGEDVEDTDEAFQADVDSDEEETDGLEDDEELDMEEEEEGLAEDKDIGKGGSSGYTKHVNDDKRKVAKAVMPKFTGDDLEGIGTDPDEDDGTGTKHQRKADR